jgi:hypothetical protein
VYGGIVELEPLLSVAVLDERVVMSAVCVSGVYDYSFEDVAEILVGEIVFLLDGFGVLLFA